MIKTAIRSQSNMVMVFDERGEQVPEYQGKYGEVKEAILRHAPPKAVFGWFPQGNTELEIIPREEW